MGQIPCRGILVLAGARVESPGNFCRKRSCSHGLLFQILPGEKREFHGILRSRAGHSLVLLMRDQPQPSPLPASLWDVGMSLTGFSCFLVCNQIISMPEKMLIFGKSFSPAVPLSPAPPAQNVPAPCGSSSPCVTGEFPVPGWGAAGTMRGCVLQEPPTRAGIVPVDCSRGLFPLPTSAPDKGALQEPGGAWRSLEEPGIF